ncbi:MAG: hypothetical protein RJA99_1683 [Pseudomonadota bacterium]|jgi:UDP-GlcNAc:undecaprenyl-phosphate GlcNAc-1-phosphate transferase
MPPTVHGLTLPRALSDIAPSAAVAFGAAVFVALLLVRATRGQPRGPQVHGRTARLHPPRIGGLAILAGFLAGLAHRIAVSSDDPDRALLAAVVALLPVAGSGLAEDLTGRVGPRQRLFWMFAGALCLTASGAVLLQRTAVPPLDAALTFVPLAAVFTAFACVGAANAFNLVDGLDGMLAGTALLTLGAISWVALSVGDPWVAATAMLLAAAVLGWMPFNWPRAALFCGDGGAYAIGFLCAVLLLLLVARHPQVSPWFGITAAALPVWETLYSIARRVRSGRSTLEPDRAHLHHLVRDRMGGLFSAGACSEAEGRPRGAGAAVPPAGPNGCASPVLWALHGAAVVGGAAWFDDTDAQLCVFVGFVLAYVAAYSLLRRAGRSARAAVAG